MRWVASFCIAVVLAIPKIVKLSLPHVSLCEQIMSAPCASAEESRATLPRRSMPMTGRARALASSGSPSSGLPQSTSKRWWTTSSMALFWPHEHLQNICRVLSSVSQSPLFKESSAMFPDKPRTDLDPSLASAVILSRVQLNSCVWPVLCRACMVQ